MADPFVAEIRIFAFNFPPKGWAFCDGQIMPLSQNTALFSLLGTTYGGDGKTTFALPDLQGRCAVQPGQGGGLSLYDLGEETGVESVTLLDSEIPIHTHNVMAIGQPSATGIPSANVGLARSTGGNAYVPPSANLTQMGFQEIAPAGGGLPHNNMMPYLTLNFCIALQGVFPPRS
jgi:microcystin-dependent protein